MRAGARLASSGRAGELALIDATELLVADGLRAAAEIAFSDQLGEAVGRLPTEPKVVTLYASSLLRLGARDGRREHALEAAALLESVLDDRPRHPGALHLLIHAYEAVGAEPLAARVRASYAELRPGLDHADCR